MPDKNGTDQRLSHVAARLKKVSEIFEKFFKTFLAIWVPRK
jgi:hypothetical protein